MIQAAGRFHNRCPSIGYQHVSYPDDGPSAVT